MGMSLCNIILTVLIYPGEMEYFSCSYDTVVNYGLYYFFIFIRYLVLYAYVAFMVIEAHQPVN